MDLSLGTPGHCPGFIPELCQHWSPLPVNLSPFESLYLSTDTAPQYPQAPIQFIVSHTAVHCCDAPIQISFQIKSPFWTSNLTGLVLGHHCKKHRLTSNKEILKIKLYSTINSIEFQRTNKNPNKCDDKKWTGRNWMPDLCPVWTLSLSERVSAVWAHRRPPSRTS